MENFQCLLNIIFLVKSAQKSIKQPCFLKKNHFKSIFFYFPFVVYFPTKIVLQASFHQRHPKFLGCDRQCMSNSVFAISHVYLNRHQNGLWNHEINTSRWWWHHLKNICSNSFWSTDDIPATVNSIEIIKSKYFHGTMKRESSENNKVYNMEKFFLWFCHCRCP
jgi:hypothetical protein